VGIEENEKQRKIIQKYNSMNILPFLKHLYPPVDKSAHYP
jgi:hypothetical protein